MSKITEKYNSPETVVIVASFPARRDRSIAAIDAVASYTDHLAGAFGRELSSRGRKLIILAQKTGNKEEYYTEGKNLIARVWDKGTPLAYASILKTLKKNFPEVKTVIVQFEFHQFGGNATTGTFPVFLASLKLLGIKTTLVMHQVVEDISSLSGHVDLTPDTLKSALFSSALRLFYRSTSRLADTLIVHNAILAERLTRITGRKDITVIPHGLGAIKGRISRESARAKLGLKNDEFVIMSFGFLAWYKGTDWLAKTFAGLNLPKTKLLIAGGESPNLTGKPHYEKFVNQVIQSARRSKNILVTGFVNDADIPAYFAACDIVVLPYRTLMSSSGPLAMTIAFRKPFILSEALAPYLGDSDFQKALENTQLPARDVIFRLNKTSFREALRHYREHPTSYRDLSRSLYRTRNWSTVARTLADDIEKGNLDALPISAIMQKRHYAQIPSLASFSDR